MNKLPELVTKIKATLNEAFNVLKRNLEFYREVGRLLTQAKKELAKYSQKPWKAWVQSPEGPGIQPRVAQFYMQLHKNWNDITEDTEFKPDMSYSTALKLARKKYPKRKKAAVAKVGGPVQPQTEIPLPEPPTSVPRDGTFNVPEQAIIPMPTSIENGVDYLKVQFIGEADLLITPSEGYTLNQVMKMIANKEAMIQEQNGTVTTTNAEVVAKFTSELTTWKITNVVAQAA